MLSELKVNYFPGCHFGVLNCYIIIITRISGVVKEWTKELFWVIACGVGGCGIFNLISSNI